MSENCSLSGGAARLDFGSISALHSAGAVVSSSLTVACSGNVTADVLLCDSHAGPGGTFTLTKGTSVVPFTIGYGVETTSTKRLYDCAAPGIPVTGANPSATYRIVGRVPPGSRPIAPGVYTDTITATVVY